MAPRRPNYGTFVNSFSFSDSSESAATRNLEVYAALFSRVHNVSSIVEYALNVNDYNKPTVEDNQPTFNKSANSILDFRVLYLILKPNLIISMDQVMHSIARALTNVLNGKPVSSNFTTEVAFMLSGSSNVGRCIDNVLLSRSDKSPPLLVVTLCQKKTPESILDVVEGAEDEVSNLGKYSRVDDIIKEFKITEEELALPGGLEASVLGRIGVKRI